MSRSSETHLSARAEVFEAARAIVASFAARRASELSGSDRLFHDLGIYGDDVEDLFKAIAAALNVEWNGSRLSDRFPDERYGQPLWLIKQLFGRAHVYPPTTLNDLVDDILVKKAAGGRPTQP